MVLFRSGFFLCHLLPNKHLEKTTQWHSGPTRIINLASFLDTHMYILLLSSKLPCKNCGILMNLTMHKNTTRNVLIERKSCPLSEIEHSFQQWHWGLCSCVLRPLPHEATWSDALHSEVDATGCARRANRNCNGPDWYGLTDVRIESL